MSIQKSKSKNKAGVAVTFRLSKEEASGATTVNIVGSFNNWSTRETPMNKLKDGSFSLKLDLKTGCEYEFRYLIDDQLWVNDPDADRYVPSGYSGSENSLITL